MYCVRISHTTFITIPLLHFRMHSHVNTASQPAGQQTQLDSGICFTAMGKRFTPLGADAAWCGSVGGRVEGDAAGGPPSYRRLADGDGQ